MPDHAAEAVAAARNVDGIELDGTPESLRSVDEILHRFHAEGVRAEEQIPETAISLGAYVGEVIVRSHSARWVPGDELSGIGRPWPVLRLAGGELIDPISKVFEVVHDGPSASVAALTTRDG